MCIEVFVGILVKVELQVDATAYAANFRPIVWLEPGIDVAIEILRFSRLWVLLFSL
jgi:hypothetical protein